MPIVTRKKGNKGAAIFEALAKGAQGMASAFQQEKKNELSQKAMKLRKQQIEQNKTLMEANIEQMEAKRAQTAEAMEEINRLGVYDSIATTANLDPSKRKAEIKLSYESINEKAKKGGMPGWASEAEYATYVDRYADDFAQLKVTGQQLADIKTGKISYDASQQFLQKGIQSLDDQIRYWSNKGGTAAAAPLMRDREKLKELSGEITKRRDDQLKAQTKHTQAKELLSLKQSGGAGGAKGLNAIAPEEVNKLLDDLSTSWDVAGNLIFSEAEKNDSVMGAVKKLAEGNPVTGALKKQLGFASPEIGQFATAQNAIAKKFVKMTDGGRPTDFDFKVWSKRILPGLGLTPEVKQAKLDRLKEVFGQLEVLEGTKEEKEAAAKRNFDRITGAGLVETAAPQEQAPAQGSAAERFKQYNIKKVNSERE